MIDKLRETRFPLTIYCTLITLIAGWQIASLNPTVYQLTFQPIALAMWFFICFGIMFFLQWFLLWLMETTLRFEVYLFRKEQGLVQIETGLRLRVISNLLFAAVGWFFSLKFASQYGPIPWFSSLPLALLILWIEGVFVVNLIVLGLYRLHFLTTAKPIKK